MLETLFLFERCNLKSVEIKLVCLWEVWLFVKFHWFTFSTRPAVFRGKLGVVNGSTCCNEDLRQSVFLDAVFLLPHASSCPVSTSKENPYSYKLRRGNGGVSAPLQPRTAQEKCCLLRSHTCSTGSVTAAQQNKYSLFR